MSGFSQYAQISHGGVSSVNSHKNYLLISCKARQGIEYVLQTAMNFARLTTLHTSSLANSAGFIGIRNRGGCALYVMMKPQSMRLYAM